MFGEGVDEVSVHFVEVGARGETEEDLKMSGKAMVASLDGLMRLFGVRAVVVALCLS